MRPELEAERMRADNDVRRDVEATLRCCHRVNNPCIVVQVENGTVMLKGFARSYFARQRAEDALRRVAGIRRIVNLIQIESLVTVGEIKCPACAGSS